MEKAIDIKRRAQRCLQSGDLDGALSEYEKLTRAEDSEPINLVLMADLLYKKEDLAEASRRYLQAVDAYTRAGLYKNAIAVCKKMARLSLSLATVLQRLAELHQLDGLSTEAGLYFQEYAEHQAHEGQLREAAESLRKAFESSPENPRLLEKAADWLLQVEDAPAAAGLLAEASGHFARRGQMEDAARAQARARELAPAGEPESEPEAQVATAVAPVPEPAAEASPEAPLAAVEERLDGLEHPRVFQCPREEVAPAEAAPAGEAPADAPPPLPSGLRFESESAPEEEPAASEPAEPSELADIEGLLSLAAERFKKGEHDLAAEALIKAARSYEVLGRLESAAAIYRSLGRSTHATPEVLALWLRNCEQRGEVGEAAEVACGLGDRALNEGDLEGAREWFQRAVKHVPDHELAARRLQRMGPRPAETASTPAGNPPAGTTAPDGRVEVAVGRAQAVTLDLGSLIAEFQRGIESQLSGDAQSHYDLGMTYREMGLLDQAVESFRAAAQAPAFAQRTAEMVGRCLLDQGRFDEAAEEFARALEGCGESSEAGVGLRFQLGLAREVAGHAPEALAEFERVYAVQPNYPDVAQKIRVLRRTLERV